MRILLLADVSPWQVIGGAERVLREHAVRLAQRGHRVVVLCRQPAPEAPSVVQLDGVEIRHVPAKRERAWDWVLGSAWRARSIVRDLPADVRLAYQPIVGWGASGVGSDPLIYCFLSPASDEYKTRRAAGILRTMGSALLGWMESRVIAQASEVLILSEYSRGELRRHHERNVASVRLIQGGVDTQFFRPSGNKERVRQELGLPLEGPLLVTVRNLVPRMGLDVLIRAMAAVTSAQPEVTLAIGGQGPLREELEQLATSLGVQSRVRFLGFVEDEQLPHLLGSADLFVLPTVSMEGFGLVTVEALACGTPVVGTSVGATPEILTSLDEGLLVDDLQPSTLSKKIIERLEAIAKDPDQAARFRRSCRAYAEKYDWEQVTDALEDSLSRSQDPPSCPFCHEPSSKLALHRREFTVRKCQGCGTLRRAPQTSPEAAERFYQCEYGPRFLAGADVPAREAMFKHLLRRLGKPEGRRLLDLGAGSGLFVRMAGDAGWQAEGTELSLQSREWAKEHHGVTLRDPVATPPPDASYDVVSIINVLDLAPDPVMLLRTARKVLRSDGFLLARVLNGPFHLRVNRLASLPGLRRLGRLGVLHAYGYTPRSLRKVLHMEGFRVLSIRNARLAQGPLAGDSPSLFRSILARMASWLSRAPVLWGPSLEVEAEPEDPGAK